MNGSRYLSSYITVSPSSRSQANCIGTLKSESKLYLFDILKISDLAARQEKSRGLAFTQSLPILDRHAQGLFELRYLRDKEKREVDFCVLRDGKPWAAC